MHRHLAPAIVSVLFCMPLCAQTAPPASAPSDKPAARVDFARDVQPILQTHCITCHGPTQQMNGFRLDRRHDAMRGGTGTMIGPGNAVASRLFLRITGEQSGMQMPAGGPYLEPAQIDVIKAWIDQGAEWPDALSGETPAPPADPAAMRLMEAIRQGDRAAFSRLLEAEPAAVKARGVGGSTPLMYAALYGDAGQVRRLLTLGADANARNQAGATALIWASGDPEKTNPEKTSALLAAGAEVNARSNEGRTALLVACGRRGNTAVVKTLLDAGADLSVRAPEIFGEMSPLSEAAYVGDPEMMQLLLDRGVDLKTAAPRALDMALISHCSRCAEMVMGAASAQDVTVEAMLSAPPFGDGRLLKALIERGADPHFKDGAGHTLLMLAAASQALPIESAQALIARGADVNAAGSDGRTALDYAHMALNSPLVDLLLASGARDGRPVEAAIPVPRPADSPRAAIERTLPLLQRTDESFTRKTGCVSCHNNTLTATTVATARQHGLRVDERIAQQQKQLIATYIEGWRERALQNQGIPGEYDSMSYILFGLAAERNAPDPATDAMAQFIRNHQAPNGQWFIFAHRPPIESSDIAVTAVCMRVLQLYAPVTQRAEYAQSVRRAARWLTNAEPKTTEDRAYQVLGLAWSGAPKQRVARAAKKLMAAQRVDGGWAQRLTMTSDAYATGEAMVALRLSGSLTPASAVYRRGTKYLLSTQMEDGSWFVRTRALPLQPYFENGFPYGRDQFVSAAATNWAAQALLLALPTQRGPAASVASRQNRHRAVATAAAELRSPPLASR